MKIDGKAIAQEIFEGLKKKVSKLTIQNRVPHVAIILVGDNPASVSYVNQKKKKAEEIDCRATVLNYELRITNYELLKIIDNLNNDPTVHGIIVQRPLPPYINSQQVNEATAKEKDIDAFRTDSPYEMPLAAAVIKILEYIYKFERDSGVFHASALSPQNDVILINGVHPESSLIQWLKIKNIVIVGKGETGGGPVIAMLRKMGVEPAVIDSKTVNREQITVNADIIISTVGKPNLLKTENLKEGVILIGVGMHRGKDEKLHGDYNEEEIKDIASFYTPIPGGVGPVNVAMLLKNLVQTASL